MEYFLSGYCRCMDASRKVLLETEEDGSFEADCNFGACPYESECCIAAEIREKLNKS